jgi:ribosomal protein S27E
MSKMVDTSEYENLDKQITKSGVSMDGLISYFRVKCRNCGHHRIMHDHTGKCEGVMNKPCNSGCDKFSPEL